MQLPKPTKVKLADITPYENNPRQVSDEAVDAVRSSIEDYGYVQPIVVDQNNVIVAGHTRYQALKKLGKRTTEVYQVSLSEEQAQKYRLVDNRTAELTDWSHDKLIAELREWEDSLLEAFFPDVNLEVGSLNATDVTEEQVAAGAAQAATIKEAPKVPMTDVKCPACLDVFKVKTTTLPGLSPEDIEELTNKWS